MRVVTPSQMQKIDKEAIVNYGIPSIVLMENAGRKVSELAMKISLEGSSISVCCGGGNNAGDGLVAARHLANRGYKVKALIFASELKGDA
ncbi:MAG TPA: bifunctional ADP-dependent NAD(P)H-hydrate dehydratase/NAD(P)H-hydrate epimerase, partial [Candidatus Omnitrophica bacterium]|nr:bifunctional ADP-dependent NAD(P)H-hydrate dehydratase/NAD(P)H-hydrate epimerase [Candidatus Omnitrophota bacterium]